jgi:hypothetical protein
MRDDCVDLRDVGGAELSRRETTCNRDEEGGGAAEWVFRVMFGEFCGEYFGNRPLTACGFGWAVVFISSS